MSKQFINEVSRMKDLFGYKKGQVISEQDFKPFDPNGSYPSLGIGGNQSKLTAKQQEAMNAGWGPVTDAFAQSLPVDSQGKIIPKQIDNPQSTQKQTPTQNQGQSIKQRIESEIDKCDLDGKRHYTWKNVRSAYQSEKKPSPPEGSQQTN